MLSSDLATLLTCRYIEIFMLPLSFSEYLVFSNTDPDKAFPEYMKYGELPHIGVINKRE